MQVDCSRQFPLTTTTDDMASSYAKSDARNANQVTVVTCYPWRPPLAGFLLIPETLNSSASSQRHWSTSSETRNAG